MCTELLTHPLDLESIFSSRFTLNLRTYVLKLLQNKLANQIGSEHTCSLGPNLRHVIKSLNFDD